MFNLFKKYYFIKAMNTTTMQTWNGVIGSKNAMDAWDEVMAYVRKLQPEGDGVGEQGSQGEWTIVEMRRV